MSLEEKLVLYKNYLSRRKSSSTERMYCMLAKKFVGYLKSEKFTLEKLTLDQIEGFVSSFNVSDRSLAFYSYGLSSFLQFVGKPELSALVPISRYEVSEPKWLPRSDVNKIINKCSNETYRVMLKLAFEQALRVGEVVNVQWDDIDFKNKTISIVRLKKKRKDKRIKPLSDEVADEMRSLNRFCDYVFPAYAGSGKADWHKMSTVYAWKIFQDASEKAGYSGYTFHCLRHSRATEVADLTNGNIVEICKVTDHDDPRSALIYVHIALKKMREVMDKRVQKKK